MRRRMEGWKLTTQKVQPKKQEEKPRGENHKYPEGKGSGQVRELLHEGKTPYLVSPSVWATVTIIPGSGWLEQQTFLTFLETCEFKRIHFLVMKHKGKHIFLIPELQLLNTVFKKCHLSSKERSSFYSQLRVSFLSWLRIDISQMPFKHLFKSA